VPSRVVSVLVNSYNYGEFVGAAIDSALQQTWPDVDVVVVDDGSQDGSWDVIRSFGDRITAIRQHNQGQAAAVNTAWQASSGDIVISLDADDRMLPHWAELAVRVLDGQPAATAAQFRMRVVDRDLRPVGTTVPPSYVRLAAGDLHAAVARWEAPSGLGPGGAMAFRRTALNAVFPLPGNVPRFDMYLVRAVALLGPVAASDLVVADYRSHGRNDSNSGTLSLDYLHEAMARQVLVGRHLQALAQAQGLEPPMDPLEAMDPILLSQRITSLRADRRRHPFPQDSRRALLRAGVVAAWRRTDISALRGAVHGVWFLVVAGSPRRLAIPVATWLLFPLSRPWSRRGRG
jgi:hypothetical protein